MSELRHCRKSRTYYKCDVTEVREREQQVIDVFTSVVLTVFECAHSDDIACRSFHTAVERLHADLVPRESVQVAQHIHCRPIPSYRLDRVLNPSTVRLVSTTLVRAGQHTVLDVEAFDVTQCFSHLTDKMVRIVNSHCQ